MNDKIHKLDGANMDIDLVTSQADISWQQDACPWNVAEDTQEHRCAIKNISFVLTFAESNPVIQSCARILF